MRIITWNVNGIRAAQKAGFLRWFEDQGADIVGVQEIKAMPEQLGEELLHPDGYHSFWHSAQKPGYSGTAIYTRREPLSVRYGIGVPEIDAEGRVLVAEYADFTLLNAYFPNSQREHTRLGFKLSFCRELLRYCERLRSGGKNLVLCGDFNIAHREIDLRNPKQNEDTAGFLPDERAWMDSFLATGYVDAFRRFEQGGGHYTWWSYRPGVRAKNIGWRLDYHAVNEEFADRLEDCQHQPEVLGSDHCPVLLRLRS